MGNRFKTKTKWLVGSLLLLSPALVAAAGLGKLSVLSALGQPLKVEIDVVALQKGESDSLTARIASPDAFRQAGVEYGAVIPQIRAAVERRNDGRAIITLKSQQPVDEPFVDVLVELNSASGRLVRQYTFLLDPVGYKGPEPIVASPGIVAQPQAAPAQPSPAATPIDASPAVKPASPIAVAPAPASAEAAPAKAADTEYEVKRGDTLTQIALAHKPQDVSLQQMLVALQRANEDAFIRRNMNLVRVGKILRIPDAATAGAVSQSEALRVVNTQTREFADYRARLAETVAAAAAAGETGQQQASGRITTQVEDKPAAAAPTDELRLSKAAEGKGTAAAGGATADDVAAREQALQEANTRVADLERNLSDLQKLLELKNQQLAQLQDQAQPQAAVPAEPSAPAAEAAAPVEPATEGVATAGGAPAAADANAEIAKPETPAADQAVNPASTEEAATPVAQSEPVKAAPKKGKPAAKPAPAPQPESFIDTLLEDPMLLAGGGTVLALLLGFMVWRRKRSASLDNSLIGMTTTDSSSVFGTTGGRNVDTGASGLQTDFSQSAIGSIDTEEVDPVAEADVYMAYGRDAQAEEILKEALQKDPSRQAVRLKLLEIYASRKDLKAFEATASEIYAATGGQGGDWEKTVSLGRSIDPGNAMYGAPQAAAAVTPAAAHVETGVAHDAQNVGAVAQNAAPLLDLDLDSATTAQPTMPDIAFDSNVSQALDLDLDLNLGGQPAADAVPASAEEPADFSPSGTFIMDAETKKAVSELGESQALDIDLGAPTLEPRDAKSNLGLAIDFKLDEPTIEHPKADVPAVDLSGLSLDLNGNSEQGADSSWQEVATKLDLAKAYEEMGDKDGARELLNEVLKEGDNAQQEQARTMLAAIR